MTTIKTLLALSVLVATTATYTSEVEVKQADEADKQQQETSNLTPLGPIEKYISQDGTLVTYQSAPNSMRLYHRVQRDTGYGDERFYQYIHTVGAFGCFTCSSESAQDTFLALAEAFKKQEQAENASLKKE